MIDEKIPVGKDRHYRLLTKEELHKTAVERVGHIAKEFTSGFDFLSDYPKSPREIYMDQDFKFPEFAPYDHELEKMYQLTNFDSNTSWGA
ncbi:MAG: hypothetical protein AABY22_07130, partial [Nanoarchaeota archaeon]